MVIWGRDHGILPDKLIRTQPYTHAPVTIGDDVWIGASAVVLKGFSIGNGAVIGAGAIVTKPIPPNAIAVGNPARVIGYRNERGS